MTKERMIDVPEHVLLDALEDLRYWSYEVGDLMLDDLIGDYEEELSHTENVMDALAIYLELG